MSDSTARMPGGWSGAVLRLVLIAATLIPACAGTPTRPLFGSVDELIVRDLRIGTGAPADSGMVATIHFEMRVEGSDTIVDSSYERNQPLTFSIGAGLVIQGLDAGVIGMREYGIRQLFIPPEMAYGEHGYPPIIPPNAPLVMKVELLDLVP